MRPRTLHTQECSGFRSFRMLYGVIVDWFFGTTSVPFQGSRSPRWNKCSDSYENWVVVIWIETTELRSPAFNLWAVHVGLLWPVWDDVMTASFVQVLRVPLPVILSPVLLAIVAVREASASSTRRRFTQSSSSSVLIFNSNRTSWHTTNDLAFGLFMFLVTAYVSDASFAIRGYFIILFD